MPMMLGDLKNKYIVHEGLKFRPWVEWCGSDPVMLEICDTIAEAQRALQAYPPDCWDDYLSNLLERQRKGDKWISLPTYLTHSEPSLTSPSTT